MKFDLKELKFKIQVYCAIPIPVCQFSKILNFFFENLLRKIQTNICDKGSRFHLFLYWGISKFCVFKVRLEKKISFNFSILESMNEEVFIDE